MEKLLSIREKKNLAKQNKPKQNRFSLRRNGEPDESEKRYENSMINQINGQSI